MFIGLSLRQLLHGNRIKINMNNKILELNINYINDLKCFLALEMYTPRNIPNHTINTLDKGYINYIHTNIWLKLEFLYSVTISGFRSIKLQI